MNKIPSAAEFEEAKRRAREIDKNVNAIRDSVQDYFRSICPNSSHSLYLIAEETERFRVYVFFEMDSDIQNGADSGAVEKILAFTYGELEKYGRRTKEDVVVEIEVDSDENVTRSFEGDYFLRLR